jgi:uncharacterized protein YutE (UPF0331/DUF86 family)
VSHEDDLRTTLSFELGQIRKELNIIHRITGKGGRLGSDEIQVRAAASSLQSIYNGIEKMLGIVLKERGHRQNNGPNSHSDLLVAARSMGIVSEELSAALRGLMAFRHFFRHSYGFMIDNELLNPLIQSIDQIVDSVARELRIEQGGA